MHDAVAGGDDLDARAVAVDPVEDELQGQRCWPFWSVPSGTLRPR
jgi:hypothetical protein